MSAKRRRIPPPHSRFQPTNLVCGFAAVVATVLVEKWMAKADPFGPVQFAIGAAPFIAILGWLVWEALWVRQDNH